MMRRLFSALLSICFLWMAAPSVLAAPTFGFPAAGQPVPRQADCRIYHFRVNAADLPLAVRSSPEQVAGNIIATLPRGWTDLILREQGGWFEVALRSKQSPQKSGWVPAERTEFSCNLFAEPVQLPVVLQGKFIGTGSQKYLVTLQPGQTLVLRPQRLIEEPRRVYWPSGVIGPDIAKRQKGVPHAYGYWWRDENDKVTPEPDEWRWTSGAGGVYEVFYDSNFKGFVYGPCEMKIELP